MRIIEKQISENGKPRLLFATNKKELELLLGVVNKAIRLFPKTGETQSAHSRLSNIRNSLRNGLKNIVDKSDYKGEEIIKAGAAVPKALN